MSEKTLDQAVAWALNETIKRPYDNSPVYIVICVFVFIILIWIIASCWPEGSVVEDALRSENQIPVSPNIATMEQVINTESAIPKKPKKAISS